MKTTAVRTRPLIKYNCTIMIEMHAVCTVVHSLGYRRVKNITRPSARRPDSALRLFEIGHHWVSYMTLGCIGL